MQHKDTGSELDRNNINFLYLWKIVSGRFAYYEIIRESNILTKFVHCVRVALELKAA